MDKMETKLGGGKKKDLGSIVRRWMEEQSKKKC